MSCSTTIALLAFNFLTFAMRTESLPALLWSHVMFHYCTKCYCWCSNKVFTGSNVVNPIYFFIETCFAAGLLLLYMQINWTEPSAASPGSLGVLYKDAADGCELLWRQTVIELRAS